MSNNTKNSNMLKATLSVTLLMQMKTKESLI